MHKGQVMGNRSSKQDSRQEKNVWKANKVAPIEFCTLERATNLLKCEIDDFIHWYNTGAINLFIELNGVAGTYNLTRMEEIKPEHERVNFASSITEQLGRDINEQEVELISNDILKNGGLNKVGSLSSIKQEPLFRGIDETDPYLNIINHKSIKSYSVKGDAVGIWGISIHYLHNINEDAPLIIRELRPCNVSDSNKPDGHLRLDKNHTITSPNKQLLILRRDIELLHNHAVSGEPIPSFLNGNKKREKDLEDNEIPNFNRLRLGEFIKLLIDLNPEIEVSTTNQGGQAIRTAISDAIRKRSKEDSRFKLEYEDVKLPDKNTIQRYLGF